MRSSLAPRLAGAVLLLATHIACEDGFNFGASTGNPPLPQPEPGEVSGLRAFAMMTAFAGTDSTTVVAELAVIQGSGESARYAGGVKDPYVRVGDNTIELLTTDVSGVFGIDSRRAPALVYVDGAEYAFGYTIVDSEGSDHEVEAAITAPTERHTAELAPATIYYADEPVEIELFDMANGGALAVVNLAASAVTWGTFRYSGPSQLVAAWESLLAVQGPAVTIPAAAFPEPGSYRIDVHNYAVARPEDEALRLTGTMGAESLIVVGRAFSLSFAAE